MGFPGGSDGKESAYNVGDLGLIPGSGKSPGEGFSKHTTPVCLPGKSHGLRSLVGYSPWGHKESDTTEQLTVWVEVSKCVHMRNTGLEEAQAGIKIAGRNINNLRYDSTLIAESEEELKSLLIKVREENEKVGLKLNIQKTKIMASGPITSWQIDGETVADFILGGSKITAYGDCSHEIKRYLLLGRKVMTNLDSILKSRDILARSLEGSSDGGGGKRTPAGSERNTRAGSGC